MKEAGKERAKLILGCNRRKTAYENLRRRDEKLPPQNVDTETITGMK